MAKKWRYITVEEDRWYREIAKKHGAHYETPKCFLLRDAPEEFDAFEYDYQYGGDIETILK